MLPAIYYGACYVANGVAYVAPYLAYAAKISAVAGATIDTVQVINDTELNTAEKTHRIATNAVFIGIQSVDFGIAGHLSASTELITKVGVGGSDVARLVSKKCIQDELDTQDFLDIGATFAFRAADASGFAAANFPDQYELLKGPTEELQAAAILISNRDKMSAAQRVVLAWLSQRRKEDSLSTQKKHEKDLQEVIQATSIADFDHIPELFILDSELNKWKCPLSSKKTDEQKPIRYVVVVDKTKDNERPAWYEKVTIKKWINECPRTLPQNWPVRVPLRERRLVTSPTIQNNIDNRLKFLMDGIHELHATGTFKNLELLS